jgi:hypothetical protein
MTDLSAPPGLLAAAYYTMYRIHYRLAAFVSRPIG